jgi:hypothetical protein
MQIGQGIYIGPGIQIVPSTPTFANSVSFSYTGAIQSWTVPSGVSRIQAVVAGAMGGGYTGGQGAVVSTVINVTPSSTLLLVVGQQGGNPYDYNGQTRGGLCAFGGGGHGGDNQGSTGDPAGYAGGGLSGIFLTDYTVPSNAIVVAGAGGGASSDLQGGGGSGGSGGDAGTSGAASAGGGNAPGGGATTTANGQVSPGTPGLTQWGGYAPVDGNGTQLIAGVGGGVTQEIDQPGGGGGAGYYSGAGGAANYTNQTAGAGGGGSSFILSGSYTSYGYNSTGDGYITINY